MKRCVVATLIPELRIVLFLTRSPLGLLESEAVKSALIDEIPAYRLFCKSEHIKTDQPVESETTLQLQFHKHLYAVYR
jgi:hypothetical protein